MRHSLKFIPALLAIVSVLLGVRVWGHGDVVPQAIDTHTLPAQGANWLDENPFRKDGAVRTEAIRIGTSGYAQNCARCHGLEAVSGGIAPDLRKLDADCQDISDATKLAACYKESDQYFLGTIRKGRARDGRVYMPPFEGVFSQEAMWAIKSYLETRRSKD